MKALITGIDGFAGSFLAELLLNNDIVVAGTNLPGISLANIEHIKNSLSLFEANLLDQKRLAQVIKTFCPDMVFHLAGASSVKESFAHPAKFFDINVVGSLNLLEAIKNLSPQARVLLVTSGEIYGESLSANKVTNEESPIVPKSPYATSKAALDMLGRIYAETYQLKIVIARPFSHIGPRQSAVFFVPTIAKQIARIMRGKSAPEIHLGNLMVYRDFTDVRDVVEAYYLLLQKGQIGLAYNICSGKTYLLKDIVEKMIALSDKKIDVKLDPARVRSSDLVNMSISNSKIKKEIGWTPKFEIRDSLREILDYWMNKIDK